jgi:ppGpp synthetase/RelA/SpoT-type nucleotidyltranferase
MLKYSGKRITKAGELLANSNLRTMDPVVFDESMDCLSFWRGEHADPLEQAYAELAKATSGIEKHPVFSKRLKRADSIRSKLRVYKGMSLRRMQDIGGCRVVVGSNKKVKKLSKLLANSDHIKLRNNYIDIAKDDGYRSIHLVGGYKGREGKVFPVEIQVRSVLQHVWATGVEMIDICTGQSLKSGLGSEKWEVFFLRLSEIFVEMESIHFLNTMQMEPLLMSMNALMKDKKFSSLISQLAGFERSLHLQKKLESYTNLIGSVDAVLEDKPDTQGYYLVYVNLEVGSVIAQDFFGSNEIDLANDRYLALEKKIDGNDKEITALVSTEAVGGIKEAYPNYFADAQKLLTYMKIFEVLYSRHESTLAKLTRGQFR